MTDPTDYAASVTEIRKGADWLTGNDGRARVLHEVVEATDISGRFKIEFQAPAGTHRIGDQLLVSVDAIPAPTEPAAQP